MGTVKKMVKRVRLNVDEMLDLLTQCAARELEIFYYYTIFSSRLIDFGGAKLQDTIEKARIEDRNHFERLVSFISEMGGEFPVDFREFPQLSSVYSRTISSWDMSDERTMLKILSETEKCAIQTYTNICYLTEGKDSHTHHLASSLLEEELRHGRELQSFMEPFQRSLGERKLRPPSLFSYCISALSLF